MTFNGKHARDLGTGPWAVGWKSASTLFNLCEFHDGPMFATLDDGVFAGTAEQKILNAYRSVCVEAHDKICASRAEESFARYLRKHHWSAELAERQVNSSAAGLRKGQTAIAEIKTGLESSIQKSCFSEWQHCVIRIAGRPAFAVASAITPNFDVTWGRELQMLHDTASSNVEYLLLGTAITDAGFAVCCTWRANHAAPRLFVDSILGRPIDRIPSLLVQVLFAFAGNMYFSAQWWSSLKPVHRRHISCLANLRNAYYAGRIPWISARLGDWTLESVSVGT